MIKLILVWFMEVIHSKKKMIFIRMDILLSALFLLKKNDHSPPVFTADDKY